MAYHYDYTHRSIIGWLGSRVVSVLDSGAEGPRFKPQPQRSRVTVLGKLFTPIVRQAEKLVAALLRFAGGTAGLAESNGSLPPGLVWVRISESAVGLTSILDRGQFL